MLVPSLMLGNDSSRVMGERVGVKIEFKDREQMERAGERSGRNYIGWLQVVWCCKRPVVTQFA